MKMHKNLSTSNLKGAEDRRKLLNEINVNETRYYVRANVFV